MKKTDPSSNQLKLLQIAYYFPPMGTVGTLPNYRFARFFLQHFSYCHILTQRSPAITGTDHFTFPATHISRVHHFDYRSLARSLSKDKKLSDQANAKSKKRSIRFFRQLLESFPFNLLIGEGGFLYIIGAVIQGVRLQRQHQFNYLYSSFRPLSDHAIAFWLKLFFPKLFWIADFRDLSIDRVRANVFWPDFQEWVLKRMLRRADLVTCASKGLKTQLSRIHPKVEVVRNGIHALYPIPAPQPTTHFTITYTGSIYPEFQDPRPLFVVLKRMIKSGVVDPSTIRLHYAGKDELVWNRWVAEAGLLEVNMAQGILSLEQVIRMQVNSQLNLMFSWSSEEQEGMLTAKLFDYLAARSPILCIVKGEQEAELQAIFEHANAGLLFFTKRPNENRLYDFILALYRSWEKNKVATKPIPIDRLEKYKTSTQLAQLMDLI